MNKTLYKDSIENALRLSEFDKYKGETSFKNLAAKFVVKGSETYVLNGKKYRVNQGEYMIGNNDAFSEVMISEKTVGLCVDISNSVITEILDTVYENPDLHAFMLSDKFLINKYNSQNSTLGHRLNELSKVLLESSANHFLTSEFFYSIGESIVVDQTVIFEQFSKLNFKKQVVNEEIFRNLLSAKTYIDDCFLEEINLDQLVHVAFISKYAFIRLFKTTFGISPYQYVLQKRLVHAKSCLQSGSMVSDIAIKTGFADTPSFSKAFKKYFGVAPSKISELSNF
jgi:AraC-like DNA-binding protein